MRGEKAYPIFGTSSRVIGFLFLFTLALASGLLQWIGRDRAFQILDSLPPVCPLRNQFGLKCSFCGMTHAFLHLFFGEAGQATAENLLSLPLFLGLILIAVLAALGRLPNVPGEWGRRGAWAGVALLASYTVLRNFIAC